MSSGWRDIGSRHPGKELNLLQRSIAVLMLRIKDKLSAQGADPKLLELEENDDQTKTGAGERRIVFLSLLCLLQSSSLVGSQRRACFPHSWPGALSTRIPSPVLLGIQKHKSQVCNCDDAGVDKMLWLHFFHSQRN